MPPTWRDQPSPTGTATPADIDRNGRPTSIGIGGRDQAGITGRLRRNAQARANIRHLVQISALGAGQQRHSCFLTSKDAADAHLMRLAVDQKRSGWGVLRPSVVIGRGGASTELFSALAAAPWPIRIGAGDWRIQPVHVADLARIIAELVERQSIPALLNVVGPESMTTDELTTILRAWLGLAPRPFLNVGV
jgi:uncharacterized protein YbjT (DUF2867 family)